MEENIKPPPEILIWLPVGYMICFPLGEIPKNFIEVDGQRLSKLEYPDLFDTLRGSVVDDGDYFVLPQKQELATQFDLDNKRLIVKIFNT